MHFLDITLPQLREDEGLKLKAYKDSVGVWTIGYGTNLQELEIDRATAENWLQRRVSIAIHDAGQFVKNFQSLDEIRKSVLVNMAYNLGLDRLSKFVRLKAAVESKNWELAAKSMRESKWHTQVGKRAIRLEKMMLLGTMP